MNTNSKVKLLYGSVLPVLTQWWCSWVVFVLALEIKGTATQEMGASRSKTMQNSSKTSMQLKVEVSCEFSTLIFTRSGKMKSRNSWTHQMCSIFITTRAQSDASKKTSDNVRSWRTSACSSCTMNGARLASFSKIWWNSRAVQMCKNLTTVMKDGERDFHGCTTSRRPSKFSKMLTRSIWPYRLKVVALAQETGQTTSNFGSPDTPWMENSKHCKSFTMSSHRAP
mgnify:CR=1 FL=1